MSSRKRRSTDADLDITSFMNLMVILIPFLLLNAVFTQVAVLHVSICPLPAGHAVAIAGQIHFIGTRQRHRQRQIDQQILPPGMDLAQQTIALGTSTTE